MIKLELKQVGHIMFFLKCPPEFRIMSWQVALATLAALRMFFNPKRWSVSCPCPCKHGLALHEKSLMCHFYFKCNFCVII